MAADVNNIAMLLQPLVGAKDEDLVWCSDAHFETKIHSLESNTLLNLVQQIQEAMAKEQVLFDSIDQQLAKANKDSANYKTLSNALCTSQARLARLCARNMRCFMQVMNSQKCKEATAAAQVAAPAGVESGKQQQVAKQVVGGLVASSVDGLISSVKRLQTNHTAMVKSAFKQASRPSSLSNSSCSGDDSDSPLYENVDLPPPPPLTQVKEADKEEAAYEHIYDQPKINPKLQDESIYENVDFEKASSSSGDDEALYENVNVTSAGHTEEVTYDFPGNLRPIYAFPNLLAKKSKVAAAPEQTEVKKDVDQDSLEDLDEPDIPSPDYGSDDEFHSGDFDLQGFSDLTPAAVTSNYYHEDQGLAVILEESEEEEEEEDYLSTLSTASAGSVSRASTPHEESKLEVDEDVPDGWLPSPEDLSPAVAEEPAEKQIAVVDVAPERTEEAAETAPPPVAQVAPTQICHPIIKETEEKPPPKIETSAKVEPEFQLPSVKNLRSHFENKPAVQQVPLPRHKPIIRPILQRVVPVNSNNNNLEPVERIVAAKEEERPPEKIPEVPKVKQLIAKAVSFDEEQEKSNGCVVTLTAETNIRPVEEEEEEDEYVEPIMKQFSEEYEEEEILKPRPTTRSWDPACVLKELYTVAEPLKHCPGGTPSCVTIEGYLDKLPSGKKKSTFWNAWKRRYFRAKDGFLYCYQNNQSEKASISLQLMGGKVESLETNSAEDEQHPMVSKMLGIDDGKGHYVVVRCANKQEKERWRLALSTHTTENFNSTYVNPWPIPRDPALLKSTIIIDLGSSSTRAGVLCTQATLPQIFFPTVMAVDKVTKAKIFGADALKPEVRATSSLQFPVKPSAKITKYSVDVNAIPGLFQKVFNDLNVDQRMYDVVLSVPRSFNKRTQTEIVNILFDQFGVNAVNMTHQSVLALYSYNATSGVVVDIGERMDIVPINEGYIVENGVSRIPYGGSQIVDHLRHFLLQKQYSLVTEVEAFLIRFVLENLCYSAQHYNTELQKYHEDASSVEQALSIKQFFDEANVHWESISLDSGRFQSTEGLFNPDAWGLDNLGVHKLVHKAIRECSMDVRKEMTRSIFLSGGVTMLPGFAERLHAEVDKVTPKSLQPKVHSSPYRYHASYIGACVLANSPGVDQVKITKGEWQSAGAKALTKWNL
ncbi:uncharacterized protein LOC132192643 [Neocloeon triangulifer]|uniref:uncharacterized protein LOC132192643 n=1 Tax=Neocloeon triangulifer TaxID=2078957 RepID=UPI00286F9387|nr:uncharacterized protein LOC132192643 [Neocloeon triangulifer]